MNKELDVVWSKILAVLETEVSRANFFTLFKKTALLSLDENIATIAAPSSMIINLIQKRFYQLIKATLDKETKKDITIIFVPKIVHEKNSSVQNTGPLFFEQNKKPTSFGHLSRVRPDYTFQTLAVSSSNQLAYISASTVAKKLGASYNPLFIYGPTGVGKTHLMQAIANEVYNKDQSQKIIYITSEEFTNEVVEAIRTNQTHAMKRKFRSANLLIIDDVQFLAGKEKVQEELFHTFNILIDNSSQIVLSSDRPPHEIKKLEQRLSSRFSGGLAVDIEPPDFELKTAILLIKSRKHSLELPIDIAKIIAEKVEDVRSLEGVLLRVITEAAASNKEITKELVAKALGERAEESHFHPEDIINKVCDYYNVKPTQLKGPKREASLVRARQMAMFLLKKRLGLTFVEIGNILGGRDHTTIMYGVEKMEEIASAKKIGYEDIVGISKSFHL